MLQVIALVLLSQQPMMPVVAEGAASYYTVSSSSSRTASGERLRDNENTCALRDGNFGDYYLFVCKETGNSVVCRLNDRGPFHKGRVADLSKSAMKALDNDFSEGVINVKVYKLGPMPAQ